jgi:sugar phosphate isomerase/epimerase
MQVGISNIGWQPDMVSKNTEIALNLGFDYIESAYIKAPLSKSVYAIQGVFYGSGISSFFDSSCYDYLCKVVDYCLENNVKVITLGSPSMRIGNKKSMLDLLMRIDNYIDKRDCIVCVEPNARKYGGEYYYTLDEIVDDIESLYSIKTMIDSGNLYLEGLNSVVEFEKHKEHIYHVHISTPDLEPVTLYKEYANIISDIKNLGYNGNVTYEFMKSYDLNKEIENFLEKVYQNDISLFI